MKKTYEIFSYLRQLINTGSTRNMALSSGLTMHPGCNTNAAGKKRFRKDTSDFARRNQLKVIETERLILRTWRDSDFAPSL